MRLRQATLSDYESILAFYGDVTERTPQMELYARWKKGKHPTAEGIRARTTTPSAGFGTSPMTRLP